MIETNRLELIPLPPNALKLCVENLAELEKEMNCSYQGEPLEGYLLAIIKSQLDLVQRDPDNYIWHSIWLLIRNTDRVVIGSAAFKNTPDVDMEVEIGYGLGKAFEHNGYMTEAVKAMCDWALMQGTITHVIAETYLNGFASQRILKRCGFKEVRREKTIWWRL
ncbi:GNAT family N-acetyltransferase [Lacrimispora sp.]|jgi:RimJ/RimL family protein N-acetyltransferase|uniref:GNAT family N-acetyltransferase n=1 Tax=Lacrimispora sp. TaxID=2719234 RepID=UPI0028AC095F|nr:GNAT family N-acetyltransferase [Lacrimispora sp.]